MLLIKGKHPINSNVLNNKPDPCSYCFPFQNNFLIKTLKNIVGEGHSKLQKGRNAVCFM